MSAIFDDIDLMGFRARYDELLDKLVAAGLIESKSCHNNHSGYAPTELGLFAYTTLREWYGVLPPEIGWPTTIKFRDICLDCPVDEPPRDDVQSTSEGFREDT